MLGNGENLGPLVSSNELDECGLLTSTAYNEP